MGIPTYTRWLCRKYPLILKQLSDTGTTNGNGESKTESGGSSHHKTIRFDNFYIDMNGIIHDCAHGQCLSSIPRNADDVFENLQNYMDRLLASVNPQKLLYLSIDGVAPRAKVKEQRGRRFRSGLEGVEIEEMERKLKQDMIEEGFEFPPDLDQEEDSFNSSNIFPGTDFMKQLSLFLEYYVTKTIQSRPSLQNLNVIINDSDTPGEGEHKIMEYIRSQRTQPGYSPNQSHVIHGLDADLSMLALSSHEPQFYILVEKLFMSRCAICGAIDHSTRQCVELPRKTLGASALEGKFYHRPLQVISIETLREYIDLEMKPIKNQLKIKYDLERIIDDYVFFCIFVGNDFLPSLPLLDIREGAVTMLMNIYRRLLPTWSDYIIRPGGEINYMQVQSLMKEVYENEGNILRRKRLFGKYTVGNLQKSEHKEDLNNTVESNDESVNLVNMYIKHMIDNVVSSTEDKEKNYVKTIQIFDVRMRQMVKAYQDNAPKNDVDFTKSDWSSDYYLKKMGIQPNDRVSIERVCQEYMFGLSWIMHYYCKGCASWDWFYPEHYAPLLRDLSAMNNVTVSFELGKPLSKIEANLATYTPFASVLPPELEKLVATPDMKLYKYYPKEFVVDGNGKRARWMGVARLPLLDFGVLHDEVQRILPSLPEHIRNRNCSGVTRLYVHKKHDVFSSLNISKEASSDPNKSSPSHQESENKPFLHMTPSKHVIAGDIQPIPFQNLSLVDARFPSVTPTDIVCNEYKQPPIDFTKLSCLLPGTTLSRPSLPSHGVRIREPTNWMGVSISDLGRGYAWSDYIQLRFYHTHIQRSPWRQWSRVSKLFLRCIH